MITRRGNFPIARLSRRLGAALLTAGLLSGATLRSPGADAAESTQATQPASGGIAPGSNTTASATPAHEKKPPAASGSKTKAGLLAAGGLVVCALLALATGIALLRVLRQR